jgi:hypothetical protein
MGENKYMFDREELANFCSKQYGWESSFAKMMVDEFFDKFMKIKCIAYDPDAELVSPSGLIDQVWHASLLFTKKYANFCEEKIGFFVHHDPNGAMDSDNERRYVRYTDTLAAYKILFDEEAPVLIWEPMQTRQDHVYSTWIYKLQIQKLAF